LPAELINYLPWPTLTSVQDEARLGSLAEVRECERPTDISEKLDPLLVAHPSIEIPVDSPVRRYAWSRGLTAMRQRQTSEVNARIVLGGRLGTADGGYKGRMPGILEEAFLSLQAELPLYIVGAFGGCAGLIVDAIEGINRPELTWEYQSQVAYSDELRNLYQEHGQNWTEYKVITSLFRERGYSGLHNGLTNQENQELTTTRSIDRIVELLFLGLGRISS
jgi:hypothetical protein